MIFILAISMTQTAYATSISDLQKQRQEKENQKKGTQSQLDSVNDQINDLSGEKDDVDAQISELTGQIAEIMASVSLLEDEIADTQVQIEQAQKDYDEAKAKEEAQYHAMKKRIQYLYEKGETSYLELLMEAKSWADMLNKAEYVQEIYTYDRKMLDNYAATVQEVAQLKESLEEQKSELEASEYELEQEKDSLQVSLDEQKELAADYEVQLAKAKQEAAAYKAKIKQQNAEIQKLASQEAARKAEEEARKREEEAQKKKQNSQSAQNSSNGTATASSGGAKTVPPKIGGGSGSDIAQYACQFVGNPYVPGGTSLTNGADCSGFTQSVYRVYGYSIPRNSSSQRSAGREVSYEEAQPGDLICYAGHVAIYLGNGRIVHASSVKTGIKYGNATYKPILSVRRIVN
ncbi:C40 family peptidase [Eisenbergiella massiliensis]|uniref:C40 family peptidase n=1 Tax=Eisenbergiella massiliensis TaxID=1720294 RepID=UPI001FA83352|nr:C40 family peptidase [Eisenbergiella massiliensis]